MKTWNLNSVRRGTCATRDLEEELLRLGHVVCPDSAGPHLAVRLFYPWKKKKSGLEVSHKGMSKELQ